MTKHVASIESEGWIATCTVWQRASAVKNSAIRRSSLTSLRASPSFPLKIVKLWQVVKKTRTLPTKMFKLELVWRVPARQVREGAHG